MFFLIRLKAHPQEDPANWEVVHVSQLRLGCEQVRDELYQRSPARNLFIVTSL